MYLYLHKTCHLSIMASILGGILYMLNPFFAATSHELPFMAPPIYIPLVFMFFERGYPNQTPFHLMLSAFCLGLCFLSGNLESYFFIVIFFVALQFIKSSLESRRYQSWQIVFVQARYVAVVILMSFLFTGFDMLPTIEMIYASGRNANASILHNTLHIVFLTVGSLALAMFILSKYGERFRQSVLLKTLIALGVFFIFLCRFDPSGHFLNFNHNILFPNVEMIMFDGKDAFAILKNVAGVSLDALESFVMPRFVFYIQPPVYLFTLTTLFMFVAGLIFVKNETVAAYGFFALLLAVFPYTSLPNLSHHLLGLSQIAFPRLMFAFYFILSILMAFIFQQWMVDRESEISRKMKGVLGGLFAAAVVGLVYTGWTAANSFDVYGFGKLLSTFAASVKGGHGLWALSASHLGLLHRSLILFYDQNSWLIVLGVLKFLSFLMLLICFLKPSNFTRLLFIGVFSFELVLSWNIYTFQKHDLKQLSESVPEVEFLDQIGSGDRMATMTDPQITIFNFYESSRPIELSGNMPLFYNVRTIEGAALNLSPGLFQSFWELEERNTYTPTVLGVFPSRIYDLMGLTYIYSDFLMEGDRVTKIKKGRRFNIYQSKTALPRFYFAEELLWGNDEHIFSSLLDKNWKPEKQTLIAGKRPLVDKVGSSKDDDHEMRVIKDGYNTLTVKTKSSYPELLASTEAYAKNWNAYIDGKLTPVEKINYYFRGVFLEPGEHKVEFKYEPWSHRWGMLLTLIVTFLLLYSYHFHRMKFSNESKS